MRDLRLLVFQVRQVAATGYFVQLLVVSTVSAVLLQWLVTWNQPALPGAGELSWVRAGIVGAWTTTCVAAGILGFQRYQGVLAPLVNSPLGAHRTLVPIIAACSVLGLAGFAIAAALAALLGLPVRITEPGWFALALCAFALGSVVLAVLIASVFVLTPNAITYEGLIAIPVVLVSGVFGYPPAWASALEAVSAIVPIAPAVRMLQRSVVGEASASSLAGDLIASLVSSLVWAVIATLAFRAVLRRARTEATLELV